MLALWLAVACTSDPSSNGNTKDHGGTTDGGSVVEITIVSPEDGSTFDFAEAIPLSVEATVDGASTKIKTATWTIGDWTTDGAEAEATDIESGDHKVKVDVTVNGSDFSDSVSITVKDAPPLNYSGRNNMNLTLTYGGSPYDDVCNGSLDFVLDGSTFNGSGSCTDDLLSTEFQYAVEGNVRNGNLDGDLILTDPNDGTEYRTPFTGTGSYGDAFAASFDYTHHIDGNTLQIEGTWNATPQ